MDILKNISKKFPSIYEHIDFDKLINIDDKNLIYFLSTQHHYAYSLLAARIRVHNMQKNIGTFSEMCEINKNILQPKFIKFVRNNAKELDEMVDLDRDYKFNQNTLNILEKSYLLKTKDGVLSEIPQYMWLRVAVSLWYSIDMIQSIYNSLSVFNFTCATPILMNAGTINGKLISCYTLDLKDDSIDGIYETMHECALLSQGGGGIGINFTKLRSNKSVIGNTHYYAKSITHPIKLFEGTACYVDQGRKRIGAFSPYMATWHIQIFDFIEMKNQLNGRESETALSLHYGLWISDVFMDAVINKKPWYLMCPKYYGILEEVYGKKFKDIYYKFVNTAIKQKNVMKYNDYKRKIRNGEKIITDGIIFEIDSRDLWDKILQMQQQSGEPYLLMKDKCNIKSNQKNRGVIKLSNLCTEITLNTSKDMTSVCCLSSIKVSNFYNKHTKIFNWDSFRYTVYLAVMTLNRVLDTSKYPRQEVSNCVNAYRPIGLGIQDLGGLFIKMKIPYESDEAFKLNREIMEEMYFHALSTSMKLAQVDGPYPYFEGSPAHNRELQFDLWEKYDKHQIKFKIPKYKWEKLKDEIQKYGLRNSTLIALMPTASTGHILGSITKSFEPLFGAIHAINSGTGKTRMIVPDLVDDLKEIELWSEDMYHAIIENGGKLYFDSTDHFSNEIYSNLLSSIPDNLKVIYKTSYEISMKRYIDMSVERGWFVCQSQSLNLYPKEYSIKYLNSMYFYAYKRGLKTLCYYLKNGLVNRAFQASTKKINKKESTDKKINFDIGNQEKSSILDDAYEICINCQ